MVLGRLADGGRRFIADLADAAAGLWHLQNHDSLGRPGQVHRAGNGRNLFLPD